MSGYLLCSFCSNTKCMAFDSGCSCHMSGNKDVFLSLISNNGNEIKLCEGYKAQIA